MFKQPIPEAIVIKLLAQGPDGVRVLLTMGLEEVTFESQTQHSNLMCHTLTPWYNASTEIVLA